MSKVSTVSSFSRLCLHLHFQLQSHKDQGPKTNSEENPKEGLWAALVLPRQCKRSSLTEEDLPHPRLRKVLLLQQHPKAGNQDFKAHVKAVFLGFNQCWLQDLGMCSCSLALSKVVLRNSARVRTQQQLLSSVPSTGSP